MSMEQAIPKEEDVFYFFTLTDRNQDGYLDGHELRVAFAAEQEGSDLDFLDEWVTRAFASEDGDGE